jgi:hypothetical protein
MNLQVLEFAPQAGEGGHIDTSFDQSPLKVASISNRRDGEDERNYPAGPEQPDLPAQR